MRRIALVAALSVVAWPALADDAVLATSKAHKLKVIAEGGANWCAPALRLRMELDADSPDIGSPAAQTEMMNRLKTPITNDCKLATSADMIVVEAGKAAGSYQARAAGGWVFVPAPPAAQAKAAVPPSFPSPPSSAVPPTQMDYFDAVARWLRDNPAVADDEGTLRLWASHRYGREYTQVQSQEFKLRPVLDRARTDLADFLKRPQGDTVLVIARTNFGPYDFAARRFPINDIGNQVAYERPCCFNTKLPSSLVVKLQDIDAVIAMPMGPEAAQAFAERRTQYGSVNRTIYLALTVRLESGGFKPNGWGGAVTLGTVEGVAFYPDDRLAAPILAVDATEFARWRQARAEQRDEAVRLAAEREAEARRQRLLAQRDQTVRVLASAPISTRLASFIGEGDISTRARLDNLRAARAAALMAGRAVPASLLVQADVSGRVNVQTRWPGKLTLSVPDSLPAVDPSRWYLVRGLLSVPEGDGLPVATLAVQALYACTQDRCADAADPAALVDRKLGEGR
ncbi:MAG: DUF4852 domain-containing protein [Alphaproteobacteria bacterium]|nr:DUF4852 domain-containing protein [Alphaproteobacteria bacterium]